MKFISYNVNGIRSALSKGWADWLKTTDADVVCLQETKAQPGQVPEGLFDHLGYKSYWHSAEEKGYSGLLSLTKTVPDKVVYGLDNSLYDREGRVLRTDFGDLTLINVYIPSGTTGDARQAFKMQFLDDFQQFVNQLKAERPNLIITGDFNICHQPIDINHPERHQKSSGFLPEEREWFSQFLSGGFVDTFRLFDQSAGKYSWWSYRAGSRGKNLGWRIDYFLVSETLRQKVKKASILSDVVHSDHCPVVLEME